MSDRPITKTFWFWTLMILIVILWGFSISMLGAYQSASKAFYELADLCNTSTQNFGELHTQTIEICELRLAIKELQCEQTIQRLIE